MSPKLTAYFDAVVAQFLRGPDGTDPRIANVLQQMGDNAAARVLAIRQYAIHLSDDGWTDVVQQWSWGADETRVRVRTPDYQQFAQRVRRIVTFFHAIPAVNGYVLDFVREETFRRAPDVRTVEEQVVAWRDVNQFTTGLGDNLISSLERRMEGSEFAMPPTAASVNTFLAVLSSQPISYQRPHDRAPKTEPTNAVPGLSRHGSGNAVDFRVKQGRTQVAGPSSDHIDTWRGRNPNHPINFENHLHSAVTRLNQEVGMLVFEGPLPRPDEPWHYDYHVPAAAHP